MIVLSAKLLLVAALAPQSQLHHLKVKGKVGDTYTHQMTLELNFAEYGSIRHSAFFQQAIVATSPNVVEFRVSFLSTDVTGKGEVFEGARSTFEDLSAVTFFEKRKPTGETISIKAGGIEMADSGPSGADMEFPSEPVPIGHEWRERIETGPFTGEYHYRFVGLEDFDKVACYRIESRLKTSTNPTLAIKSGPPNTWYISKATGIVVHATATHPVEFQGKPGYIHFRLEQVSGPR